MYRPTLFITQTIVIVMVAIVHLSAMQWYLYWYYPWLDLLTHFLGGLWVALASAWLIAYSGRTANLLSVIGVTMGIGIAWEIFELSAGVPREANFAFDTSLDLCMDFFGGLCGYLAAHHMLQSRVNGEVENHTS